MKQNMSDEGERKSNNPTLAPKRVHTGWFFIKRELMDHSEETGMEFNILVWQVGRES